MKSCPNCRKANAPAAKFCGGCGASLENVQNIESAAQTATDSDAPLPQALASEALRGAKLPPLLLQLQIALIAIAVSCVGKFFFGIQKGEDYWGWTLWLVNSAPWIGLCGFAVGCLLKNKVVATVCAVFPMCATIIVDFEFYIIYLPKVWHDISDFSLIRSLFFSITDWAFFASLALLAWLAVPHLIAVLDDKRKQPLV